VLQSAFIVVTLKICLAVAAAAALIVVAVRVGRRIHRFMDANRREREAELLDRYPEVTEFLVSQPGKTRL